MKYKFLSLIVTSLLLNACGIIHNHSDDYLSATSEPALKMPASASNAQVKDYYTIPEMKDNDVKPISLVPPGLDDDIKTLASVDKAQKAEEKKTKEQAAATNQQTTTTTQKQKYNSPLVGGPSVANMGYEVQNKPIPSATESSDSTQSTTSSDSTQSSSDSDSEQETTQTKQKPKYDSPLVNGPSIIG